jgi:hypothetical protein
VGDLRRPWAEARATAGGGLEEEHGLWRHGGDVDTVDGRMADGAVEREHDAGIAPRSPLGVCPWLDDDGDPRLAPAGVRLVAAAGVVLSRVPSDVAGGRSGAHPGDMCAAARKCVEHGRGSVRVHGDVDILVVARGGAGNEIECPAAGNCPAGRRSSEGADYVRDGPETGALEGAREGLGLQGRQDVDLGAVVGGPRVSVVGDELAAHAAAVPGGAAS